MWLNLKDPAKQKENQAARRKHFRSFPTLSRREEVSVFFNIFIS